MASAIINRCGFNSEGIVVVAKRLGAQHGKRMLAETSSTSAPQVMARNMEAKLDLAFLVLILERTRQVKMLLQIMYKGFIRYPSMLITWYIFYCSFFLVLGFFNFSVPSVDVIGTILCMNLATLFAIHHLILTISQDSLATAISKAGKMDLPH